MADVFATLASITRPEPLPNLSASFAKMKIQDYLMNCTHPSTFGAVVQANAKDKLGEVIAMCREQIKDNRLLMVDIIGEQAVILIEKL